MSHVKQQEYNLAGWLYPEFVTVEQLPEAPECYSIGCAGMGYVTVDLNKRCFALGYAQPLKHRSITSDDFKGAGWKFRLLDAALAHLIKEIGGDDWNRRVIVS